MRAQPPLHTRSDRAWVSRWLEVTTANMKELHQMRLEAEEKVRGVLEEHKRSEKGEGGKWQRKMCLEQSLTWGRRKIVEMDQISPRSLELEQIQEEVLVRLSRPNLNFQETSPLEDLAQCYRSQSISFRPDLLHDLVEGSQAKGHTRRLTPWITESLRPAKSKLEQTQEHSIGHPQTSRRQNQALADLVTNTQPWLCQSSIWTRRDGEEPDKTMVQSEEAVPPLPLFPNEPASLRRIGSGSFTPRLRLGSSGVTSDLLFTRRMSGNCLSAHSSGFYETSDLDSISSSCSSLCSDISCHTSVSLISPHRTSVMRPRSIDCTPERRKELQSAVTQANRPMSAGALDGYLLQSASNSRLDLTQSYDMAPCDYLYHDTPPLLHDTPPLCAIQQRRKAERYICKLALKYRCKPGVSSVRPDLGPPISRRPAQGFPLSGSHASCPSSPQVPSLSSSLGDVRKSSTGSWGRFLSRVMLKKDSRIAASELNLEQCGKSSRDALQSPLFVESQFMRAKSFRDLLSVNPFKRSQRGLNKAW